MDHMVVTLQTHHTRLYLAAFTRWRHQCRSSTMTASDRVPLVRCSSPAELDLSNKREVDQDSRGQPTDRSMCLRSAM